MFESEIGVMYNKTLTGYGLQSKTIVNPARLVSLYAYDTVTKCIADNSIIVQVEEEEARELVQRWG